MNKIRICPAQVDDLEEIAQIEANLFSAPWTLENFQEALKREENIFLCAKCQEAVVGYALLYTMLDEGEIPTIATHPDYTRRGVGEQLLRSAILESESRGVEQIFLEVRQSNAAAIGLYKKCDFEIVGTRKGFYRLPTEDAYVCCHHK